MDRARLRRVVHGKQNQGKGRSSNRCSPLSLSLSTAGFCSTSRQVSGRTGDKDPVNGHTLEGFIQKTVVASPEVSVLSSLFY